MGNSYSSWRMTLFVLNIVLAQDLGAVICRPVVTAGMGDPDGLNDCINAANGSAEDYIIDLGGGIYTYDMDSGSGYALPTIDGNGMLSIINGTIERSRESGTDNFGIINIAFGAYLTLFNISIENGSVFSTTLTYTFGSAINNAGTLSLENCLLQNNSATATLSPTENYYFNGAIYNTGTIDSMANCIFVNNSVNVNSTNTISIFGGAINNGNTGIINEINQCTFSYNNINGGAYGSGCGAGISNIGTIGSISNSVFNTNINSADVITNSYGGAICNVAVITTLSNSTFYGNQVTGYGGGIYNDATISINNCTISGNIASAGGGGIANNVTATISSLYSNIVANNTSGDSYDIANVGSISSEGFNLVGATSGTDIMDGMNGDIVINYQTDPLLGPLQDNGGITYTMALLPGSLAVNNGYNPNSLLYDQRGSPYLRVVCSRPDIGAFEVQTCP